MDGWDNSALAGVGDENTFHCNTYLPTELLRDWTHIHTYDYLISYRSVTNSLGNYFPSNYTSTDETRKIAGSIVAAAEYGFRMFEARPHSD